MGYLPILSFAALTTVGEDGKPSCQRLTDVHSPKTPSEYFRVAMAHPVAEEEVLAEDRVLGFLAMTRGQCHLSKIRRATVTLTYFEI